MADENKKGFPDLGSAKDTSEFIKTNAREQDRFTDSVRDSVKELDSAIKKYEKMSAVLISLQGESVNLKKIEAELLKAKTDEVLAQQKLLDLERSNADTLDQRNDKIKTYLQTQEQIEKTAKQIEEISKFKKAIEDAGITDQKILAELNDQKLIQEFLIGDQIRLNKILRENELDTLDLQLIAMRKLTEEATNRRILAQETLDAEKEVVKRLGTTGKLLEFSSKYLSIGKGLYSDLVKEARKGESATMGKVIALTALAVVLKGIYNTMAASMGAVKDGMNALTGTGGPLSKVTSQFTNLVKQIPLVGGILGGIMEIGVNIVDMLIGANSETQKFGRNLGLSYEQAKRITDEFVKMSIYSGQAYLTVEKLRQSQTELSQVLGLNNVLSMQMLESDAKLREQAGLDIETRKGLLVVAQLNKTTQTEIYKMLIGQTAALRNTVGVNIRVQDSIKELSKLSGVLGLTFAKYPQKMTETLLTVKALGMDLQKLDSIASGMLNFEESLSKEFQAQLITGKDINLNAARQFALTNDMAGLAKEIATQFGSSSEYVNMMRIEQEALADAAGMTRDELADVLMKQALYAKLGAQTEDQFKRSISLMKERGTLQQDFLNKLSEEEAQYYLNSTATENIANFFDKIKQSFANLLDSPGFKKLLDNFMATLNDPNFVENLVNKLTDFAQKLVNISGFLISSVGYVVDLADYLSFGAIPNEIPDNLKRIGSDMAQVQLGSLTRSSAVPSSTSGTTTTSRPGDSNMSINLAVNAQLSDSAREASVRYDLAPKSDYRTGVWN